MIKKNSIVLEILKKRGIIEEKDIAEFISSKPMKTYDPFSLHNMEAGVDFVLKGIEEKKKIYIYGDYDTDGVTSIVILKTVLEYINGEKNSVNYYIPSRIEEGYGLSIEALNKIKEQGGELVITVDCGSVSYEEVEYAKKIGLEIIVTDHHALGEKKPSCLIINPKQEECKYPFKGLAGCGVAYKLAQALITKTKKDRTILKDLLDVLAVGTVGDIVPLIDENRTFVKYGLKEINLGKRPGIVALLKAISKEGEINSETIGYIISPHINASGRMSNANIGVELLLEKDKAKVDEAVEKLVFYNKERKKEQENIQEKCEIYIEEQCHGQDFLIIYAEDAHEGITGIVASKIKEKFNRPTAIVTDSNEGLKGTSRSIKNINLHEFLKTNEDIFLKFGGHKGACGFSLEKEKLPILRERVSEKIEKLKEENQDIFAPTKEVDVICLPEELTLDMAEELKELEPYGEGNEKPIMELKNVTFTGQTYLGSEEKHVKFYIKTKEKSVIECVKFFVEDKDKKNIFNGEKVDVWGTIGINQWNNRKTVQLIVNQIETK